LDVRRIRGYLQLCRPANLPTAAADIIAGLAIAGILVPAEIEALGYGGFALILVSLAGGSKLLYAGGVVLNDVFDAELDKIERPERPIPSGLIPKGHAALFGGVLLLSGIGLVSLSHAFSTWIAVMLGGAILIYDGIAKQHDFFGPLFMGICRGLNLWMGMYMMGFAEALPFIWIPVVYIFAITSVSRGEVDAGNRKQIILAGVLYAIAILGVAFMTGSHGSQSWWGVPFLSIFAAMVYLPLIKAYQSNTAGHVRAAVKGGVLGLVVMDAAWVAGFAGWIPGILVLGLLPLSGYLSKRFAVT
jgi:4-hydroxybenzoate polyprenyltransferase